MIWRLSWFLLEISTTVGFFCVIDGDIKQWNRSIWMFSNIFSPVYEFQTCWSVIQIHFISELQYICWKLLFEIKKSSEKLLTIFNHLCLHAWKTMELWKIQWYDLAWPPRWLLRMTSLWEQRLDTIPTILLSFGTSPRVQRSDCSFCTQRSEGVIDRDFSLHEGTSRVPQLTCIWMSGASGLGKLTRRN